MTTSYHTADMPYPNNALAARLDRVERRQDNSDSVVSGLLATTAVHSAEVTNLKDDIRDLIGAIAQANQRVANILRAIWALVLVLIPVAVSLVTIAVMQ